jgi:osmoprotectant transport system permease protein
VSLGAAFWVLVVAAALAIADTLQRLRAPLAVRVGVAAAIIAVFAVLAANGWFDDLSLVREWANRRDTYGLAFAQHMTLVGTALVFSLIAGVPLGIVAARRRQAGARIFDTLNILQTIPSIALFGLLIGPLTGLAAAFPLLRAAGLDGIGFAPAVLALVLYALLPVARNTEAAVRSVPADLIETARGMGMTAAQILLHVTLPVASPILLAGLRIVVVQLIGLAVVAALIGAGGFGTFVFLGLGQTATDLVLLGALSAIALALVADELLRLLSGVALARVRQ